MSRFCTLGFCALVAGAVLSSAPAPASAADRVVMAEEFTATWCVYCPRPGRALHTLITNFPDTFFYVQLHEQDVYNLPWATNRQSYYAVSGYPTVWFDGKNKCVGDTGSDASQYSWFLTQYNARRAIPTDVSVQLGGELVGGTTYRVTARVAMDAAGSAKVVRLYILHALDHFPSSSDNHYRNCLRPPAPGASPWWVEDVSLTPGMVVDRTRDFTFDTTSMGQTQNIRVFAWLQKPASNGASGQGEFWNAKSMSWPFTALSPLNAPGDLNCDGAVDFSDIDPFVMAVSDPASYAAQYPNCDILLADCNGDGVVDFNDVSPFVELLSGG